MTRKDRIILGCLLCVWFGVACDQIPGLRRSSKENRPSVTGEISGTPGPIEYQSSEAKRWKENSELLSEMVRVIFDRDVDDRTTFGNWLDSMNQGASIEGIYNGLAHSSDYRKLEIANQGAAPRALRIFGEELAYLQQEWDQPKEFDPRDAKPLQAPVQPEYTQTLDFPKTADESKRKKIIFDMAQLSEKYSNQFVGASLFTLKRVLGDELLKVIESKSQYRENLAQWYSKWVVRMNRHSVDFGLGLRNKADESFHYRWALQATPDRIRWESLNRAHRVLNHFHRMR